MKLRRLHLLPLTRVLTTALTAVLLLTIAPWAAEATGGAAGRCHHGDRGRLLGLERVASHPTPADAQAYFDEWYGLYRDFYQFPADPGVRVGFGFDSYKVTYCTIDVAGPGHRPVATAATGNLSVPRRRGPSATVAYFHGTAVSFYDAPSNPTIAGDLNPYGESFEGPPSSAVFAGSGFIYVAPDYLGLGDSTVPRHRYFNADLQAATGVDLLQAADRGLRRLRVRRAPDLFTFGFSEGSHAAFAVDRALQHEHVPVTATATAGGVFDVERAFLTALDDQTTPTLPLYLSYLLLSYDDVYDLFDDPAEVFQPPYADSVSGLFDMRHSFDEVIGALPPSSGQLLTPAFVSEVRQNPRDPLRVRLRQNALDGWRPRMPIRIYQSPQDQDAKYANALVSVGRLRARGAQISVQTVSGDHVNSWIQALPQAALYFAGRR